MKETVNTLDFNLELTIDALNKEINKLNKRLKALTEYRDDLVHVQSMSNNFNNTLISIDRKFEFYMKMEEEICKTQQGSELWHSIKATI